MTHAELERTLDILRTEVYPAIFETLYSDINEMHEKLSASDLDEDTKILTLCQFASCRALDQSVTIALSVLADPPPDGTRPSLFRVK